MRLKIWNGETVIVPLRPQELDISDKFQEWRASQWEAIHDALTSKKRFVVQSQPTGSGKSLTYYTIAKVLGKRVCILTSTKALQDQIAKDFPVADIRGQNAYKCLLTGDSANYGPCRMGYDCPRTRTCPYIRQYRAALKASIVLTNYSYFITINRFGRGLGKFDLLVCDEAHNIHTQLCNAATISIRSDLLSTPPDESDLTAWALYEGGKITNRIDRLHSEFNQDTTDFDKPLLREISDLKIAERGLETVRSHADDWLLEKSKGSCVFTPVWAGELSEELLFSGIPKVITMSANICQKSLSLIGIKDYDYFSYKHTFPLQNRLVYHIPTTRVDFRMSSAQFDTYMKRVDEIIESRLDRKGIIHGVSYKRCQQIMSKSRFKKYMITHYKNNLAEVVERFKNSTAPSILISPSIVEGYDFPGDQCYWQIVAKVPFPDTRGKLMALRKKSDPEYPNYIAMQKFVQACGRGVRSQDDVCETFILDDHMFWFFRRFQEFAPDWFYLTTIRYNPTPVGIKIAVK